MDGWRTATAGEGYFSAWRRDAAGAIYPL